MRENSEKQGEHRRYRQPDERRLSGSRLRPDSATGRRDCIGRRSVGHQGQLLEGLCLFAAAEDATGRELLAEGRGNGGPQRGGTGVLCQVGQPPFQHAGPDGRI